MAFPTGYAKYQNITIDHTKVAGDLTDYVVIVNLANLVKAGADIFDTCRTDGGDLRATKTDGTTELAIEIVAIDTTAKTGEVHIKFSGTLSSSTDTVIRLYYNGTDTLPAVTDTYGRNAVWTGYNAVYHFQTKTLDSTGNGYTLTETGTVTQSSALHSNGIEYTTSASNRLTTTSQIGLGQSSERTMSGWVKWASETSVDRDILTLTHPTAGANYRILYEYNGGTRRIRAYRAGSSALFLDSTANRANNTWLQFAMTYAGTTLTLFLNGASITSGSNSGTKTVGEATGLEIGIFNGSYAPTNGIMDEYRIANNAKSANWLSTEYNNHNSPSTFYSVGDELGGSTIVSPSAQVATFTVPAYSIIRGVVLQATVQTATLSLPQETVLTSVQVNPITQVATFTVPAYIIIAQSVMFFANANTATFSLPASTVLRGSVFSPDAQTLTFTVSSRTIATGNTVSVEPVVLTFTIPALAFIGALWRRSSRSSANWTRSAINND